MNSQINNENQVHSIGLTESGEQLITALTDRGGFMKRVRLFFAVASDAGAAQLTDPTKSSARLARIYTVIALLALIILVAPGSVEANDCVSNATGNWSSTGTWTSCGGTTPQSGDTVTIANGHTVTLDTDATITSLTVGQGASGTLTLGNSTTSRTLTVNGDVTVSAGATFETLSLTGSTNQMNIAGDFTNASSNQVDFVGSSPGLTNVTFTKAGTQNLSSTGGGGFDFNNVTVNSGATLSINTNVGTTSQVEGTLTVNSNAVVSPGVAVVINNGAAAGTITGSGTIQVTRTSATADYANQYKFTTNTLSSMTVDYAGTGNQIVNNSVGTYGAVKTSGTGTKTAAGALTIAGGLMIGSGTTFAAGTSLTHNIGGDWTNNGTFSFTTASTINFNGNNALQTISGSSATAFSSITVNKGTLQTNILEANGVGALSNNANMTLTSGTFKITTGTFQFNAAPTIQATAGLWVNGGTVNAGAFGHTVNGLLRVSAGTLNIGTANGNNLNFNTGSTLTFDGGTTNIASKLLGATTTQTTTLSISGSAAVNLATVASTATTTYPFDLQATGSSFTMSGGTIAIRREGGGGTDDLGYRNLAATTSVTGGTLQIGDASTPASQTMQINSTAAIFNLTVNAMNSPIAKLQTNALTVKGSVTISGGTLDANSLGLTVGGNWTNNATFTSGTQTTTFNGSSGTQTIGGSAATAFSSLTINNAGTGVTLDTSIDVGGSVSAVLTLTTDLTVDRAERLTQSGTSSAAATGDVIGTVRRTDVGTTARSFGNVNTQITVTGGSTATMDVNLEKGAAPASFASVTRVYSLEYGGTGGSGTFTSATVRLRYLDSELGGNTEALLTLYRHSGAAWVDQGQTTRDTTNNFVEETGVTAFSPWTLADGGQAPTAVNLKRFGAASFTDGVALWWESGYEVNNLGYRLYREQNGLRTRVTPSVVAGSALKIGANQQMRAGYSYSWFDPHGTPGTAYYLEAIDLNGERQWTGPIYPASGSGESPVGKRRRAMLLSEVSAASSGQAMRQSWPAAISEARRNGSAKSRKESLGIQQQIAAGQAVKIALRQNGWYRLSQSELVAAGLDASADARNLQLYVDGQQVPIELSGDGSHLAASDTIEFYGVALNTPTTDTHVYYLINGATPGMRISNKRSRLKGTDLWSESVARNFAYTTERQDKLIYFPSLLNGETDNIFGALIMTDPVSETIAIKGYDQQGGGQPQLEIALQGATKIDHAVQVQLNGATVGTIAFGALSHHTASFTLDRTQLHDGDNTLTFVATNGQQDVSFVDWVRVTYAHPYTAGDNALTFSMPAGQAARVDGFTNANIRVVDITDPNAVIEVPVSVGPAGTGYAAKLQTRSASVRTLVAFTDDLVNHPATVTANQASNWNSGMHSADLVIITHRDFRQTIEPLAAQRRSQGLNVAVVDVEDVYDEFSYGAHTPYAVRDFLAWTTSHWQTTPQYVLLVGDSSWDPRNYLDQGNNDFVPTKLIDMSLMETMSDDWVADFNGDGLAEMAVGRLPGRTSAEVGLMLSKINAYEVARQAGGPPRGALLVSDRGFEGQNSQTKAQLSPSVPVQTIDRAQVNDDAVMSSQVVDSINQGPMLVNYYGHGSVDVWTGAGVLNDTNAATLSNSNRLSVFVIMTCLNGYAGDAYIDSLGESLMKAQNGGAAAVWASSGFTEPQPQFAMSTAFYQQAFGAQSPRIGDAIRNAKASIGDNDVRRTWILLGDPTMRLR